jgi:hypothetical protein
MYQCRTWLLSVCVRPYLTKERAYGQDDQTLPRAWAEIVAILRGLANAGA